MTTSNYYYPCKTNVNIKEHLVNKPKIFKMSKNENYLKICLEHT